MFVLMLFLLLFLKYSFSSRRNGEKSPGNNITNPALNRSRKSDAALETFPVSSRSSRKPSFTDAKSSAKKNTRQPSRQLETKDESIKKSKRRVLPKNILTNNNADNNFDGLMNSSNYNSNSSSSDDEFDVILSPRVLKRI